jgi:hypothetical protein
MNRKCILCTLAMCVALATSCTTTMQTYPGERLPPDRVARIDLFSIHRHMFYDLNINVAAVDGMNPTGTALEYEVLPGDHTLYLRCYSSYHILVAPAMVSKQFVVVPGNLLTFRAEAGRRYKMNGEDVEGVFFIWLEDAETGSVVAGRKPEPSTQP